jgi:drug/metabolite transporter (DMT)-like permease
MVRRLGQIGANKAYIVFFFSAFSCVVTLPYLILSYMPMSWKQLLILILAGLAAAGGQFGVTSAYCYAPAKEISVYDYTQIIFAAGLGFLLFAQIPDWLSILGYCIIISMAAAMFIYNKNADKSHAIS